MSQPISELLNVHSAIASCDRCCALPMDNPHDRKGGSLVVRSIIFQQNDLNSWKFKIIFTQGVRGGAPVIALIGPR